MQIYKKHKINNLVTIHICLVSIDFQFYFAITKPKSEWADS